MQTKGVTTLPIRRPYFRRLRAQRRRWAIPSLMFLAALPVYLRLHQRVEAFQQYLRDLVEIDTLDSHDQFHFLRRLLNFDAWCIVGKPQTTQYLDLQVVNSDIDAERNYLRIGDGLPSGRKNGRRKAISCQSRMMAFVPNRRILGSFGI